MSKIEIELCPVCEKVLKDKHGLAVDIVYSTGGWGHAKNLFSLGRFYKPETHREPVSFSEEICTDCFDAIMPHLKAATNVYKQRRGINRPEKVKI